MDINRLPVKIERFFQKIPLRLVLIVPFVLQISAAVGLTGWLSIRNGQQAVNDVATQLRHETSDRIEQHLNAQLENSHLVNRINLEAIQFDHVTTQDLTQLGEHFWRQLQIFKSMGVIYFGDERGRFIAAQRLQDDSFIFVKRELPPSNAMVYRATKQGKIGEFEKNIQNFIDIRQRPWYVAAKREGTFTWGNIFALQVVPRIDLPASVPVRDREGKITGVLGTNLALGSVSEFLQTLEVGKSGQTFVIERNGKLVASSSLDRPFLTIRDRTRRISVTQSQDKFLRSFSRKLIKKFNSFQTISEQHLQILIDGERYFVEVLPYTNRLGLDWLIVVVIPESDFMAQIRANTRLTIILCAIALVISTGSGILTARWISRPILRLNEAAKEIEWGNFRQQIKSDRIDEIGELANSFDSMALQLQSSFTQLQSLNQALSESESKLTQFLEALPVGVSVHDTNGQLIYTNKFGENALGIQSFPNCTIDEMSNIFQIYRTDTDEPYPIEQLPIVRALNGMTVRADDLEIRNRDRSIPLEVWATPIYNERNELIYAIAAFQDISDRKHAALALQESERKLRQITNAIPGAVYQYELKPNGEQKFLFVSQGIRDLHEILPEDVTHNPQLMWNKVIDEDIEALHDSIARSAQTLEPWHLEFRIQTTDRIKWILGEAVPNKQENDSIIWNGILTDISDRKAAELALQQSELRFRNMAENVPGAIFRYVLHPDGSNRVIYMSSGCYGLWEVEASQVEENAAILWEMVHPEDLPAMSESVLESARTLEPWYWEWRITTPSGQLKWLQSAGQPERQPNGDVVWDTLILDVSDRKAAEEQLIYNALHDTLTDLPNRNQLMQRLELEINRIKRSPNYRFAVLFLDLDRFKTVNDSLGHLVGDRLLVTIAQKLKAIVRSTDIAARLGGDEFVLVLSDIEGIQEAVRVTERIFAQLQTPIQLDGREVFVTTSIGIVLGNNGNVSSSDLLRDADIAMYRAKACGRANYEIFNVQMHDRALRRLHLENDLRRALDRNEFVLYYQPIVSLNPGRLVGFEALVRWNHPDRGFVSPGEFIPLAEETGLIVPLDCWVLQAACQQLVAWQNQFSQVSNLKVGVNLSARDLLEAQPVEQVDRVLDNTGLASHCLNLEITESMLIRDIEATIELLEVLKQRGVQISIDDFGTGYSSLSYLHRLPIDTLKIDRVFVSQMQVDHRNYRIVETIIALADRLELGAIAEGIENHQQLQHLQQLNCEFGQGYLFAKPLAPEAAVQLFRRESLL